jgi:hypothetical protein
VDVDDDALDPGVGGDLVDELCGSDLGRDPARAGTAIPCSTAQARITFGSRRPGRLAAASQEGGEKRRAA